MVHFSRALKAFRNNESRKWEHTRLLSYTIYSTTVDSDKRCELYDYLPLATDPKRKKQKGSVEERNNLKLVQYYIDKGYMSDPNKKKTE